MEKSKYEQYEQYDESEWDKIMFDKIANSYIVIHKQHGSREREEILLALPERFVLGDILRGVISAINADRNRKIEIVGLLFGHELIQMTRKDIENRDFSKIEHYLDMP